MVGLYLALAARYPIRPSLEMPRASWTSLIAPTASNLVVHIALYLGLTLLYAAALRLATTSKEGGDVFAGVRRRAYAVVGLFWLGSCAALFTLAPAGESHDIFDYLFRGRMMVELGANPLVEPPLDFRRAPYWRYLAWHRNVDTYGPVWELGSAGVSIAARSVGEALGLNRSGLPTCPLGRDSCDLLLVYLTGYRLFAVALAGICGGLIVRLVSRGRPWLGPAALVAWLWNPMTLMASAVGAHNDLLMLALFFLALWLLLREHPTVALVVLLLAAHVKLTALIWLPAIGLWIVLRRGLLKAAAIGAVAGLTGLGVSWLLYAPFGGWASLPRMLDERGQYLANSLWAVGYRILRSRFEWDRESTRLLGVRLPTLLFVVVPVLAPLWAFFIRPWRRREKPSDGAQDDRRLWSALLTASLLVLLFGSFWFQHWYILWALAPAALLPDRPFTRGVLPWLVFGALSANVLVDFAGPLAAGELTPVARSLLSATVTWLPALVAGAVVQTTARAARRTA